MSLNGLDGIAVAEAHQAALADAGGWYVMLCVLFLAGSQTLIGIDQVPAQVLQSRHR